MTTTVVKKVGTGGDYTTWASWAAACPPNLVTVDQIWQGQQKNEELTLSSTLTLSLSSGATDSTRYMEMTTDTGASFVDNASKVGRYDSTKGAGIKFAGTYAVAVQVSQAYTRINKLQFSGTATGSGASAMINVSTSGGTNCDINQCIIEGKSESASLGVANVNGASNVLRNTIVINRSSSATGAIVGLGGGSSLYNVTMGSTVTTRTNGIKTDYGAGTVKNCYVGNSTNPISGPGTITKTNCYSSTSATGFTVAAMSTANFANVTDGSHDFQLAAGSALIGAGADEPTYASIDVFGVARTLGAYAVGAAQYVAGAINLAATALVKMSGSAALTTSIALAAAGSVVFSASASFPSSSWGASGFTVVSGSASLTTGIALGASGSVRASGSATLGPNGIVSDVLINNTGTVRDSQAVSYSWFPGGRIGSFAGITPTEGTGTTGSDGRLTTSIPSTPGVLMIAVRNAGATTDDVYYQAV